MKLTGENLKEFNELPRTGIHPMCDHPLLSSQLVGAFSCDNIECNNCCSFTVLHIHHSQKLDEINKLFPEATHKEKELLFWDS